jgi:hypothetical protein
MFPYGPNGPRTNEIDIEYAFWGHPDGVNGDWVVYPASGTTVGAKSYRFSLNGATLSTSRFIWASTRVDSFLMNGLVPVGSTAGLVDSWVYTPANPTVNIPQQTLPLGMNLWCFESPPSNGQNVEVVIRDFQFVPLGASVDAGTPGTGGMGGGGGNGGGGAAGKGGTGGSSGGMDGGAGRGGAGGRGGTGGASSSGGAAGTGGSLGGGGASGSGGHSGDSGASGSGGAAGSGGDTSGVGGRASGSGGAAGPGGAAVGSSSGGGGASTGGGASGDARGPTHDAEAGCGCRLGSSRSGVHAIFLIASAGFAARRRRKRR